MLPFLEKMVEVLRLFDVASWEHGYACSARVRTLLYVCRFRTLGYKIPNKPLPLSLHRFEKSLGYRVRLKYSKYPRLWSLGQNPTVKCGSCTVSSPPYITRSDPCNHAHVISPQKSQRYSHQGQEQRCTAFYWHGVRGRTIVIMLQPCEFIDVIAIG